MTRLVLIRHGESTATVERVIGGVNGCRGLSERGRAQAEALRDRLARTGELSEASVLMASVLPRAVQTAEIIAPALGGLPVVQDCDLCEIHPGECDGLSYDEYEKRYGTGWVDDLSLPVSPGGESYEQFHARVKRTLLRIAQDHEGEHVVIACHGGVVDGSLIAFWDVPGIRAGIDLKTANTSITEWELTSGGRWRLVRYNDAAHLAGVP